MYDIEYLRNRLEFLIETEQYEKAAIIRDWIIEMENKIKTSEDEK